MPNPKLNRPPHGEKLLAPADFSLERAEKDISSWDLAVFNDITSCQLSPGQAAAITHPDAVYPRQKDVLAVHWHPEWIPHDLIARRLDAMFPDRKRELIIPTQHNQILSWGEYSGVEVDCFSAGFNRKVQLLIHWRTEKLAGAGVFRSMLEHTFRYRQGQLFEFMDSIVADEFAHRLEAAADETGANGDLVNLVRFYTARLRRIILDNESSTSPGQIKNKLVNEFLEAQRARHPDNVINRALLLVRAVKQIVKQEFSLDYFFRATEIIEEARSLGGCVVIPHPEQFWPILLADYDVDGWEVWNPQSREYTDFLITALNNHNKSRNRGRRELLVFMGDDTHLSIKAKDPKWADQAKLAREVGLQPAWEELAIRKALSLSGASRAGTIEAYKERLG